MNLVGKVSDSFHFVYVEVAFIHSVCHDIVAELTTGKLVEHFAVFAKIDDFSVIERGELLKKLVLFDKRFEYGQNLFVHLLCCIIVRKTAAHWN